MSGQRRARYVAGFTTLVCCALFAAGCAPAKPATPTSPPTSSPIAARTALVAGSYVTHVVNNSPEASNVAGDWLLQLNADGTYLLSATGDHPGQLVTDIRGHYTLGQNQVTLVDDIKATSEAACYSKPQGVYNYAFDGTLVAFRQVSDPCPDRNQIIPFQAWTKQ